MRALTCAFLTLGLVLATCAGCGDTGTPKKKPSVSTQPALPGAGVGEMSRETETTAPSTAAETPAAEEKKEGAEEKATAKPAEDKPAEEKKADEKKPEEEKKTDEKSEEKKPE